MTSRLFPLDSLASLAVTGPDARSFLQGQLSSNLDEVTPSRGQLSGWHDPKGRTLAFLRVLPWREGFLLVTHAELAAAIEKRLRMFILRAKVTVQAGPRVYGVAAGRAGPLALGNGFQVGAAPGDAACTVSASAMRMPGRAGWLVVGDTGEPSIAVNAAAVAAWERAEVEAGIPEVYAVTSGQFVAQMLNLDWLGAVSFTKGCYPGQEIVARAHHLGRVKRRARLFRFAGAPPAPGDALADSGGTVVRTAVSGDDCLLMAVVPDDAAGPFALADGRLLEPLQEVSSGPVG
jgi:folate-binding protein YgfZ